MSDGVEIRVHGIGDHNDWSGLGSPTLIYDGAPLAPDVAQPPTLPDHTVLLVNWSRTSRKRSGWLWYLALPFTVVNAAGYMVPTGDAGTERTDRQVRTSSVATGLVLTVLGYVWLVAIVETIARRSLLSVTSMRHAGTVIAVAVGVLLSLGMAWRRRRRSDDARTPFGVYALNMLAVVAATVATLAVRPAHQRINAAWMPDVFTTYGPSATYRQVSGNEVVPTFAQRVSSGELVSYLDALTTTSVLGILLVVLIAFGVLVRGLVADPKGDRPSALATAMALVSAAVLLISVASALRLFLDNFVAYLSRKDLLLGGDPEAHAPYSARIMLPPLNTYFANRDDYAMDLLSILGAIGVLALLAGSLLVNLLPFGAGRARWTSKRRKKKNPVADRAAAAWRRELVMSLPKTLGPTLAVGFLCWLAGIFIVARVVTEWSLRYWDLAVFIVQATSVAAVATIIAGRRVDAVRKPLSMLADLLGFWPVASHPLAGASYRSVVVAGISEQLHESTTSARVLVGHSQGSVLCAWTLAYLPDDDHSSVDLVTCGSPLRSLYALFFPRQFDAAFFERIKCRARNWVNFWRDTDPIATPVTGIADDDIPINDPDAAGVLRVHSDYWTAPKQLEHVAALLSE